MTDCQNMPRTVICATREDLDHSDRKSFLLLLFKIKCYRHKREALLQFIGRLGDTGKFNGKASHLN